MHDLRLMVDYGGFERSAVAATERDGSFRIPDLEPGAGTLKTWGPFSGEGEYPSADLRVVVAPGMEPLRVVVDRGVAVRLRVLRADGSAARRAVVDGRRAGMPTGEAESLGLTSDDGTLECRLVPGAWEFSARRLDSVWGNPVGTDAEATAEVRRGESPVVELRFAE